MRDVVGSADVLKRCGDIEGAGSSSGRRGEETALSTQMLRYLRRVEDLTTGKLRWGMLWNTAAGAGPEAAIKVAYAALAAGCRDGGHRL